MARTRFKTLLDDTNSLYIRRLNDDRYQLVELIDMEDACGRDNEGHPKYVAELSEVDLSEIGMSTKKGALNFCGLEDETVSAETLVECLHAYGAKAPLENWSGNNRSKLVREAKAYSYELDNPTAHAEAMKRPVNEIGSTAREYMVGDITSAIRRGVSEGRRDAEILAKMYT